MSFPADSTPAVTTFDDLARHLERAAPHVTDVGAWEAIVPRARRIRRRRRALRGGVSLLVAAMLVGGGAYLASLGPTSPDFTGTSTVQPGPSAAALPPAPDTPTAALLARGSSDPRAAAVFEWIRVLHAGDLGAAWELLDDRAQAEYGNPEGFAAAAAALTLRWGAWDGPGSWGDLQLVDLGLVRGERLAVATVFGQWSSGPGASPGAYTAPRADSILVVSRPADDGASGATVSRIDPLRLLVAEDPSESSLVDEGKALAFTDPSAPGQTLSPDGTVTFKVPRRPTGTPMVELPGTYLLFLDGTIVGDQEEWSSTGGGLHRVYRLGAPPSGRHAVTAVFIPPYDTYLSEGTFPPDDGGQMSAAASFFTVGDAWGDPDEPTPTVPPIDAPPLSEGASRAALASLDTLLRAVRLDDRASFVDLYAPTDRAAAEQIFADERARLQRLGSNAYYLANGPSAQVNWMVGVDWGLTWTPMSPSPELGTWVAADPQARVLASITTMDDVTRFLPMDVDGDTVHIHVLGGDPGMEALGAFDILGRTASDVAAAYFAAFQKSRYEAAWEFLSDARPSLDRFKEESAATATPDRREAGRYVILDNGDAWVDVTVLSPPDYSREGVPVTERWLCVKQDGEWRIDHAERGLSLP